MQTLIVPHPSIGLLAKDRDFKHIAPHFIMFVYEYFLSGEYVYTYRADAELSLSMLSDAVLESEYGSMFYDSLPGIPRREVGLWVEELVQKIELEFWKNEIAVHYMFKRIHSATVIGPDSIALTVI